MTATTEPWPNPPAVARNVMRVAAASTPQYQDGESRLSDPSSNAESKSAAGHEGAQATAGALRQLTVVYDETCELCRRCRQWLSAQAQLVELRFLAAGSPQGEALYGKTPWYREELMVVSADGHCWVGPEAFIMCLWATANFRNTAYRLRGRALAPMAERFFHSLSDNRPTISSFLAESTHQCDGESCSAGGWTQAPSSG